MESYIKFADTLSTSMGKAFSWCIVILMGGTVYEVVICPAFQQGRDILWFWGLTSKLGIHTASLADIGDKPIKSVNIC